MKTIITLLITAGVLTYSLAVVLAWHQIEDESDWAWWQKLGWSLFHAFAVIRDWVLDAIAWAAPRAARASVRHTRKAHRGWRSMRASWRRRRADRRRPVPNETPAAPVNLRMPGPSPAPAAQPQPQGRTVAMPRRSPTPAAPPSGGDGPAPAGGGGSFGTPVGGAPNALGPFGPVIEWIASRDPEDSTEFENDLKLMFDGWLGMGEAFEQFAETCAESGIGLDPVVIRSILDLAGQVSENGEATVRVKKVLDAVYEGFREWASTHRPTKDGRWIQPESGAGPQAGAA